MSQDVMRGGHIHYSDRSNYFAGFIVKLGRACYLFFTSLLPQHVHALERGRIACQLCVGDVRGGQLKRRVVMEYGGSCTLRVPSTHEVEDTTTGASVETHASGCWWRVSGVVHDVCITQSVPKV